MLSFIIPARDRPAELDVTLDRLARLTPAQLGGAAEIIVIDNDSATPLETPTRLANGVPVELARLNHNAGAAARNVGAGMARGDWLVMLDDDSSPEACDLAATLECVDNNVAAVGGEIRLSGGGREAGGLPEVVVGCGCAIRREAFLSVGGYDPSFDYYVEEYDLCARLIIAGLRVTHTRALRFEHRKAASGRSFDRILHRLVRNNGWTISRYAPDDTRSSAIAAMLGRYEAIGRREGAQRGFRAGRDELSETIAEQPRRGMSGHQWARFVGADAARRGLAERLRGVDVPIRLVSEGKGADVIRETLGSLGFDLSNDADCAVIGSLSPGPMLDAMERHGGALAPWRFAA